MTGRAAIIGATGQVGLAAVTRLTELGWSVTAIQRGHRAVPSQWAERGVEVRTADRGDTERLRTALAGAPTSSSTPRRTTAPTASSSSSWRPTSARSW